MAEQDRADRLAERLTVPVLVAALASVPAVFLTLLAEPWASVGNGLNLLSGAVLVAEAVVLFAVAEDRRGWLRRNRLLVLLAVALVPAVVLAVGPVQLLRLVRAVGALRILRVRRILKAGRIVRHRIGPGHRWQRVAAVAVTGLGAVFVAMILVDPSSSSRQLLDGLVGSVGVPGVVVAGLLLAGATFVVVAARERDDDGDDSTPTGERSRSGSAEPTAEVEPRAH